MNIQLADRIDIRGFLREKHLGEYNICDCSIGSDDGIHILLAERIPQREQGMFVPTVSNTHYQAVSLTVGWQSGGMPDFSITDFGKLEPNLHSIQRLGNGFLLLGARAQLHKDGKADRNALIADSTGSILAKHCFGDGIQQCLVDSQNRIITSYFDEGVFGNFGWDQPIGACGLIVWSAQGERLWENQQHDICDCYAINLDDQNHLWFYYYTAFNLVQTDYSTETVYQPQISGSSAFLLDLPRQRTLFDAGYGKHGTFLLKRLQNDTMTKGEPATFTWKGNSIAPNWFSFRNSKALLWDNEEHLHYTDWALTDE